MNRTQRPKTAEEIRNEIEKAETRIRLENLTIEALKNRLIDMQEPLKRPQMGEADMLFCRTANIDTVGK